MSLRRDVPILEFDPTKEAIIEPSKIIKSIDIPEHCVITFFNTYLHKLVKKNKLHPIANETSEMGSHPIYELEFNSQKVAVLFPGIGAPLATGLLEYVIGLGCKKFVACGSAGMLYSDLAFTVMVPDSAIRDEGTSYHYLPPGREVQPDPDAFNAILETLKSKNVPYRVGKTWTTDALYRETPKKTALRKTEGCISVEMEAAAFFAVSKFRSVQFAQMLYGSDHVSDNGWSGISRPPTTREKLFWWSVEAVLKF